MNVPWKNYFFTVDFTAVADFLSSKPEGHVFDGTDADTLAIIFQENDPRLANRDKWVANDDKVECDFNTVGAEVVYNGKNGRNFRTNAKFSHVMVLKFSENQTCPHGKVYLQYNLVEETSDGNN